MHRDSWGAGAARAHSVKADNGMLRALVGYGPDGGAAYKDAERFAATPALLDQLITTEAELQQLKEQIEGLADWHDVKASKARVYPRPQEKERFIGKAEAHETARNKLTQILEGHNE